MRVWMLVMAVVMMWGCDQGGQAEAPPEEQRGFETVNKVKGAVDGHVDRHHAQQDAALKEVEAAENAE